MKDNKCKRSWQLKEMVGYLVIMGVITVGAIWGYIGAYFKYQQLQMSQLVSELAVAIQSAYLTSNSYDGLDTAEAIRMGLLPTSLNPGENGQLLHPQGGKIEIFSDPYEKGGDDRSAFIIRFYDLDTKMCAALAGDELMAGTSSGLMAVEVRAKPDEYQLETSLLYNNCEGLPPIINSKKDVGYAVACRYGSRQSLPLNPRQSAHACNCSDNTCMITWKYH